MEFQRILDLEGTNPTSLLHTTAHLGLARGRALAVDLPGARRAYQDFLTLWKDADPEIPLLTQARSEYAALSEEN